MAKILTQVHRDFLLLLLCVAALLFLGAANHQTWWIELEWDANTEKDITGYRLYYRAREQINYEYLGETAKDKTDCVITGLEPLVNHFFAVTAYDVGGLESDFSKELKFRVNLLPPGGDSGCFIGVIRK